MSVIKDNFLRWVAAICVAGEVMGSQAVCHIGVDLTSAEAAVNKARQAIVEAETMVSAIPEDSSFMPDVVTLLGEAFNDWSMSLKALEDARFCIDKMDSIKDGELKYDYSRLAEVNGRISRSRANAVVLAAAYIKSVAQERLAAIEIIRVSMRETARAKKLVSESSDRIMAIITMKHGG